MKISEVQLYPNIRRDSEWLLSTEPVNKRWIHDGDIITTLKGNIIFWDRYYGGYAAMDRKTKVRNILVSGDLYPLPKGGFKAFAVDTLTGRSGNVLKAHEFYRAILLKQDVIFRTSGQSFGGLKVWQRLAEFPDIEVFGWNPKVNYQAYPSKDIASGTPQAVELDPDEYHSTHADDADILGSSAEEQEEVRRVRDMYLVAHRKMS